MRISPGHRVRAHVPFTLNVMLTRPFADFPYRTPRPRHHLNEDCGVCFESYESLDRDKENYALVMPSGTVVCRHCLSRSFWADEIKKRKEPMDPTTNRALPPAWRNAHRWVPVIDPNVEESAQAAQLFRAARATARPQRGQSLPAPRVCSS